MHKIASSSGSSGSKEKSLNLGYSISKLLEEGVYELFIRAVVSGNVSIEGFGMSVDLDPRSIVEGMDTDTWFDIKDENFRTRPQPVTISQDYIATKGRVAAYGNTFSVHKDSMPEVDLFGGEKSSKDIFDDMYGIGDPTKLLSGVASNYIPESEKMKIEGLQEISEGSFY